VEDSRLDVNDDFSPTRLFQKLRGSTEFRAEFARCARRHLTGEGALTATQTGARYRRLVGLLDTAILAESARWGDYRRDVHPYKEGPYELYTRDAHWRPEVKRLLEDYFAKRTPVFIAQLKAAQLYAED
jgi:hypothetical protein